MKDPLQEPTPISACCTVEGSQKGRNGAVIASIRRFFGRLFACRHRQISRVFNLHRGNYVVCMTCGKRLKYSWSLMAVVGDQPEE